MPKSRVNHNSRTTAHRVVCIWAHGDQSDVYPLVAHSCRNRNCVNPRHLRWATFEDNQIDREKDGTKSIGSAHKLSKLTEEQVLQIRVAAASGEVTVYQLADMYGVTPTTISKIRRGYVWNHVGGPISGLENQQKSKTHKLNENQVREIRKLSETLFPSEIAGKYGVKKACIYAILSGRTWKNVI